MTAGNFTFGGGELNMERSTIVTINRSIEIVGSCIKLPIKIEADFKDIPERWRHIYLQSFESSYSDDGKIYIKA